MKKIYLLAACALMAGSISAKELSFQMGGKTLVPGETYGCSNVVLDTTWDTEYPDIAIDPHLFLVSDIAASDVTLTAECTSGQKIQVCAGGDCAKGTTVTKKDLVLQAGVPFATDFEYTDVTGKIPAADLNQLPVVVAEVTAMYGEDASTAVKVIIAMSTAENLKEASVTVIKEDAALRVVEGGLVYNVDKASTIALYDMSGKRVMSANVRGEGQLSTAGLARGIYAYTISGGKSGKIFVK